jgi:hypothetical protein
VQRSDQFIYDPDGDPFHLAGTRIYRDQDGGLVYDCPHCGRHPVPLRLVAALTRYEEGAERERP